MMKPKDIMASSAEAREKILKMCHDVINDPDATAREHLDAGWAILYLQSGTTESLGNLVEGLHKTKENFIKWENLTTL